MYKLKIPVQMIVEDLMVRSLSDQDIMEKYGIDYRHLILAMGKLAEKRKIPFKRIIAMVRGFLEKNELRKAEECIRILQKYFIGVYGIQTTINGLERDLLKLKNQLDFQKKMNETPRSLARFESLYPELPVDPAVAFSVKILNCLDADPCKPTGNRNYSVQCNVDDRLGVYPAHLDLFNRRGFLVSTRLWHQICLKLFYQKNIEYFIIKSVLDPFTRDVCMHLDSTRLPVKPVLLKIIEQNREGKLFFPVPFPSLPEIENLARDKKVEILIKNGWSLPPFCEKCRCQIFPC